MENNLDQRKNNINNLQQKEENPFKDKVSKTLYFLWDLTKTALLAFVIVLPIRYYLFQPFVVKGESMFPNFHSGDYLIVDEISYRFKEPQRGDVIVFNYPKDPHQKFIKRIIGLPKEKIIISGGEVKIIKDGKEIILQEDYLKENIKTYGDVNITLGPDEYFVLGDNRDYSYDSRMWGVVPRKNIIGKVFIRLFPIINFSIFKTLNYSF